MKDEGACKQDHETLGTLGTLKSVDETVHIKLTGQRHRLKQQAKEKLERAGWIDELRLLCRQHAATCSNPQVDLTYEFLVAGIGPKGKARVPDYLKAELLAEIKSILEQPTGAKP